MRAVDDAEVSPWALAVTALSLFAVDPVGTGGVAVKALPGPVRDRWLALARERLPLSVPLRRIPLQITDDRLLGGLDLAATLQAARPVVERGILAEADGGVVVLAMAERLAPMIAARLAAALDTGEVAVERDGLALRLPARFGVIALDEGMTEDERAPAALLDRLAFHIDLTGIGARDVDTLLPYTDEVVAARARLSAIHSDNAALEVLCAAALALGIGSLRAPLLALRVARAAAALVGRSKVSEADLALAGQLVLAPRAMVLLPPSDENNAEQAGTMSESNHDDPQNDIAETDRSLADVVLAAAQAAIPAGLLARLVQGGAGRARAPSSGRAGALRHSLRRGRPVGVRSGELRADARLNVVATLRAAAPWQPLRRRAANPSERRREPIEIRRDDFRITRFKQRAETTTIFVVDASGSSALHRLAEAKGAVELLLADCYVRRDRVALIAFRGRGAELLLPPTRSLVRAKRSLASLPGGGGTPLASGIDAAVALADAVRRRGDTPVIILLTDGRANIARDGSAGPARAEEDALAAARLARAANFTALLVDTSPRPQPPAQRLATELGASYLPLPYADAAALSGAVRAALPPAP